MGKYLFNKISISLKLALALILVPSFSHSETISKQEKDKNYYYSQSINAINKLINMDKNKETCLLNKKKSKYILTFIGSTEEGFVNCIKENSKYKKLTFIISSFGGETDKAIEGSRIINNLNWDVEIIGPCLSSCGNYIVPAAKTILVRPYSFIALHGAPNKKILENNDKIEMEYERLNKIRPISKEKFYADLKKQLMKRIKNHDDFAKELSVSRRWYEIGDSAEFKQLNKGRSPFLLVDRKILQSCVTNQVIKDYWTPQTEEEKLKFLETANNLGLELFTSKNEAEYDCK